VKCFFYIQKKENDSWKTIQDCGFFNTTIEANEKIYNILENKSDFWEHYRVLQYENKHQRKG
jgi:hypothetical protein